MFDFGKAEQNIIKQAIRFNKPIPARIANAPSLNLGSEFYFDAFFDLDSDRSHGFSLTRISWSSIVRYGQLNGLTRDAINDLVYIIQAMDSAHLQRLESKHESKPK